jgi:hypothetical protein
MMLSSHLSEIADISPMVGDLGLILKRKMNH